MPWSSSGSPVSRRSPSPPRNTANSLATAAANLRSEDRCLQNPNSNHPEVQHALQNPGCPSAAGIASTLLPSKRKYRRIKRARREEDERLICERKRVKVALLTEQGANAARNMECCARQCFRSILDVDFLLLKRKEVLQMSRAERKLYLIQLFNKQSGKYMFDGLQVCSKFLISAFGFSNDTICSVKGTPKSRSTSVVERIPRMATTSKRDLVVAFLQQLAETQGDKMPDKTEVHLTYRTPGQVFSVLQKDWMKWSDSSDAQAVSFSYFTRVWKEFCPGIKVRSVHRFSLCDTCETLKAAIEKCGVDVQASKQYRDALNVHYELIKSERAEYRASQAKAAQFPETFCSIIIDGANQEAFSLPHFSFKMKAESTGYSIKMGLIGLLEHLPGQVRELSLFTMAEDMETGSNHIIEVFHRWLQKKAAKGPLPPCLLIQLDNCSRENKNKFFFGYLETLVSLRVFEEVRVSFLPKGHTHEDIDQVFSCTARALRPTDAVTLSDLHEILRGSYSPRPTVNHLSSVANIRDAMKNDNSLLSTDKLAFTQYRYFVFGRRVQGTADQEPVDNRCLTTCSVKGSIRESFQPLRAQTSKGSQKSMGFLRQLPNLHKVPDTITKALGKDIKDEITKRLNAVETRIDNNAKLSELRELRDLVYSSQPRVLPYSWAPDCVERKALTGLQLHTMSSDRGSGRATEHDHDAESESGDEQDNEYERNAYVAVRTNDNTPFWVGQIQKVENGPSGLPRELNVLWLQARKTGEEFNSKYGACVVNGKPVKGKVNVRTVLVTFSALNKDGRLPSEVRKNIRSSLADVET